MTILRHLSYLTRRRHLNSTTIFVFSKRVILKRENSNYILDCRYLGPENPNFFVGQLPLPESTFPERLIGSRISSSILLLEVPVAILVVVVFDMHWRLKFICININQLSFLF